MPKPFAALPGLYTTLFLHLEPLSTLTPFALIHLLPGGAAWFHHELVPTLSGAPSTPSELDDRTKMAIWQLGNCYVLLAMVSSLVFRAVRSSLPNDPVAQERILGACFFAYAVADITHIVASFVGLPSDIQYTPWTWNATTHGNITAVIFLFAARMAWFAGIGRTRYWYGQNIKQKTP